MKKLYTLAVFLIGGFLSVNAQITLDSTNMPYVGFSIAFAKDTPLTSVNYGSAGANQAYDFSNLHNTLALTTTYSTPNTTQHSKFPTANLMVTDDNVNYFPAQNSPAKYIAVGEQTSLMGHVVYTPFSPLDDIFHFTTQYQGNFSGSWGFIQTVPASWVGQGFPVDSVMVTYTDTYNDTIDGWGTVKTPIGTYKCLREARRDQTHTNIQAYYFGSWSNVSDSWSDAVTYQYLAKETKGPVVKFDYDTGVDAANLEDVQYSLIPAIPIAGFTFANGSNGMVNFTDTSLNTPTSYSWTFGDGGTGNTADPSHTYTANGAYYVCETVTNASGSDTYCDSVHITNVTAGPTAHFTFVNGANGLVTFTDASTGSPTSYSWTFGDGGTSASASPMHTYTNDGVYYVCETVTNGGGSNTYCDSVHVSNVNPPVAHFTEAAGGGGVINFTDGSTGSPTTYSWTFGDGGISNQKSPSHTYSANGAYYVCETVSNVNGNNTYCDSVHVTGISGTHQAPVARNDTGSVIKPNSVTVNVTANDYSPSADSFCVKSVSNTTYFSIVGCSDVVFNSTNAPAPGVDSTWYVVCNVSQPALCDSALLIVNVEKAHVPPVAVNDYDTFPPGAGTDTINVTANDYSPSGDSFCITGGYGSGTFFPINCNDVGYTPDSSTFTGNDTAWYIICNNNQPTLCDTAEVVVTVTGGIPCMLTDSIVVTSPVQGGGSGHHYEEWFTSITTPIFSSPVDSFYWTINANSGQFDTVIRNMDTVVVSNMGPVVGGSLENVSQYLICLTASNQCGSATFCDTVQVLWSSINDLSLSNIALYPNPANNILTIDMRDNRDEITTNYTAIEIYNTLGQQVITQARGSQYKTVSINVASLPDGIYLATLVDAAGVKRALGKFTMAR